MVVYWDVVALFNAAVDYLLMVASVRLSGLPPRRGRIFCAALLGAAYAAAQLAAPRLLFLCPLILCAMGALAFYKTGRAVRLTLLFAMLSCALAGVVVLLGTLGGSLARLSRGVLYADLPWSTFGFASAAVWLFSAVFFRGSAKKAGADTVRATFSRGGRSVTLRLLRDSGNLLRDPRTGKGVPVVDARALRPLLDGTETTERLPYRTVGDGNGTLEALRLEVALEGKPLGERLAALSAEGFRSGNCAGIWYGEEEEEHAEKALAGTA